MFLMFGEAVECLGVGWMIQGLIPAGARDFLLQKHAWNGSGPSSLLFNGYRGFFMQK